MLTHAYRKKYFSSQERLCIAQQSAVQGRRKQHGKLGSWLSSTSTSDLLADRPSTAGGLHSLKARSRPRNPKLFLVHFDDDSVSEEEARWFLSLPEKAKKKKFGREELVSLTARAHCVLGKAAAERHRDTVERRQSVHRLETVACNPLGSTSLPSTRSTCKNDSVRPLPADSTDPAQDKAARPRPSRIHTDVVEISKIKRSLRDDLPAETNQVVETALDAADAEMEILKLYLQRRSLKPEASASRIKRSAPGSPPTGHPQPTKRRPRHRLPALTPLPLPPPVLSPAPRSQTSAAFSTSARLSRPFWNTEPLSLGVDASAGLAPSRDSARDLAEQPAPVIRVEGEILELPANEEPTRTGTDEDCPYPHLVSAFSDDDTEDDDNEDDENLDSESVETIGPRTPSPMDHADAAVQQTTDESSVDLSEFRLDAPSKTPSVLDRASSSFSNYSSSHGSIGSRTKVLRTSSEEILYAYQRRLTSGVDVETCEPLALEALPVCDDNTGAHGAFAMPHAPDGTSTSPSKGLKRVFKSFRRL